MKKSEDKPKDLIPANTVMACPACGASMKKVSWIITAGAFDAGKEVEQTTYQCADDKNFISVEVSTGHPSEFAVENFEDNLEAYEL